MYKIKRNLILACVKFLEMYLCVCGGVYVLVFVLFKKKKKKPLYHFQQKFKLNDLNEKLMCVTIN